MARRRRRFRPGRRPRRGKRPSSFGEMVAVPFYREEQWEQLRAMVADPEHLETSHGEWLSKLRRVEVDMKRIGVLIRTVDVDVDQLKRYCEERGFPNTREFRSKFAADMMRQRQLAAADEDDEVDDDADA